MIGLCRFRLHAVVCILPAAAPVPLEGATRGIRRASAWLHPIADRFLLNAGPPGRQLASGIPETSDFDRK